MGILDKATDEAVTDLCLAIAKQAAKDYMQKLSRIRRLEHKMSKSNSWEIEEQLRDARQSINEEINFFKSEFFHLMFDTDPNTLLRLMEESVKKKQKYLER